MLTIFSIPKPFRGHIGVIQRNALHSWLLLEPACEIVLCGDDEGVAEIAEQYSIRHLPNIARNEFGTPIVSSAFDAVLSESQFDLICYVNADIIFLPDLTKCISHIDYNSFLLVGRRWDIKIEYQINFNVDDWRENLRQHVLEAGSLHRPTGSDYFVFPKNAMGQMPDFAVGRPGWDNWFIYYARSLKMPVVDLTPANMVIHQEHDYAHVRRDKPGRKWQGPEELINRELMGGQSNNYSLYDATHIMTHSGVRRAIGIKYFRRRLLRSLQRISRYRSD